MRKVIVSSMLALSMAVGTASAAKQPKQENEVTKALKDRYPDAQTQINGSHDVNGVRVFDVKVTNKMGDSTAQITNYGDFLMYGVPHEYGNIESAINNQVSGLFKSKPDDVDMYRVTNYYVDFKNPNGKTFTARFDAVGRLLDIYNQGQTPDDVAATAAKGSNSQQVTDKASLDKAASYAKRELGKDVQVASVTKSSDENGFWVVALQDGGQLIVNPGGQVYSLREPITKDEFPEPVAKTIQSIFNATIDKLWRGEYEYYQFNEQSQTGTPIVVKMRPNGDILEVQNTAAQQDEQASQAKSKTKASSAAKKKG